jgi:hypothetical protein
MPSPRLCLHAQPFAVAAYYSNFHARKRSSLSRGTPRRRLGHGAASLPGFTSCDQHRIPYRGEGWGIGKIKLHYLVSPHIVPQSCGKNVNALPGSWPSHNLGSQEATAGTLGEELDTQALSCRPVAGCGSALHSSHVVRETGGGSLGFCEASTGDLQVADLGNRRAKHAGEGGVFPHQC